MRQRATTPVLTGLAALVLLVAGHGCSVIDEDADQGPPSALAGRIDLDGSSTLEPFTALAAERFQDEHPRVAVVVSISPSRTSAGFDRFCTGETDLASASRRIEAEEVRACRAQGIEYVEFQVAIDALTVVVNPDNEWVSCLTTGELEAIWEPGSAVESWREVRAGFPDEPLELFGASDNSGTFEYFTHEIVGEEGASRSDYTGNEDDFETARDVAETKGGLGYFGHYYFSENDDRLKALEIDDGTGCVEPSVEAVQNGEYALSRPLYLYANTEELRAPSVLTFLGYALDNAKELAEAARLVPVPEEQLRLEQEKFEDIRERADVAAPGPPEANDAEPGGS